MADRPDIDFTSKEEFREVCRHLSARMHYLNRVAMGESGFAWTMAEVMARLGRVFEERYDDKEVQAAFGDGWTAGTVAREDRVEALIKLAFPEIVED